MCLVISMISFTAIAFKNGHIVLQRQQVITYNLYPVCKDSNFNYK